MGRGPSQGLPGTLSGQGAVSANKDGHMACSAAQYVPPKGEQEGQKQERHALRRQLSRANASVVPSPSHFGSWRGQAGEDMHRGPDRRPKTIAATTARLSGLLCERSSNMLALRALILPSPGVDRRPEPFCSKRFRHVCRTRPSRNDCRCDACLSDFCIEIGSKWVASEVLGNDEAYIGWTNRTNRQDEL
jgi:hypothetical protein